MVKRAPMLALLAVTTFFALALLWQSHREGSFTSLWLTPDQRGIRAYRARDFEQAAELFEDPAWRAVANYRLGRYEESAALFGRGTSARDFYNRGNALMKGREYRKAIAAFEQAVAAAPESAAARENLALSRYVLDYLEDSREQSGTDADQELGADEYAFDNEENRGSEMLMTEQDRIEIEAAEKWMRTVDTDTRDFLRSRFLLEVSRETNP